MGCRHSSVGSSVPSILPPRVQLPSTPSLLLSSIVKFVLYLSLHCEKNENKQKRGRVWPIFKERKNKLILDWQAPNAWCLYSSNLTMLPMDTAKHVAPPIPFVYWFWVAKVETSHAVLQSNKNKTYRGRWDRLSVS